MIKTKAVNGQTGEEPPVIIDLAYFGKLESLAFGAHARAPAIADRLLDELDRAQVMASAQMPSNIVSIGNTATYHDETTGRDHTVTLVLPGEADIALGRVSVLTPIGVALLGLSEGASFWWATRQGETRRLTVTRVSPGRI